MENKSALVEFNSLKFQTIRKLFILVLLVGIFGQNEAHAFCSNDSIPQPDETSQYIPLILRGYIFSEDRRPVERAWAVIEDVETGQRMDSTYTLKDGSFRLKSYTIKDREYEMVALADGHFFKLMRVKGVSKVTVHQVDTIFLPKMETDKNFILDGLNFEPNSIKLSDGAAVKLERLFEVMRRQPKLTIAIEGYSNGAGNPSSYMEYETKMSNDRAKTVHDYLINKGISKKRLSYLGFGRKKMINPNAETIEDKKENMRVEVKIKTF